MQLDTFIKSSVLGCALLLVLGLSGCGSSTNDKQDSIDSKAQLGERLFSDVNLSLNRSQSCATCHSLDHGFIDNRINDSSLGNHFGAGSLGDDDISIGDRNAPSAGYAAFSPVFKLGSRQRVVSQSQDSNLATYNGYLGGQFWDGRAENLAAQAGGPPLNPGEMNMPSKAAVVDRLMENATYVNAFENLYSADIFNDAETAYNAMAEAIGEFEKKNSETFYPFDSKYDKSLTGEYEYDINGKAILGKSLFFSSDLTCASCHQLRAIGNKGEIFTSFEYHNIGVPENSHLREVNGVVDPDFGLALNPSVIANDDVEISKGKFKVPTLRNVAITAPYMHNGIFNQLDTVIRFYEHAKKRALEQADASVNPETQLPWGAPEVDANISNTELGRNDKPLGDTEVDALVCFLMTLTDAKFEHLLDAQKIQECGI